jgi:hypothetical protein
MHSVAPDISKIVMARICFRPSRSPSGPQTRPPSGRIRNDTAKIPKVIRTFSSGIRFAVM